MTYARIIDENSIQQADITVLALEIASQQPDRWIAMSDLKRVLLNKFNQLPKDGEKSSLDQVIGNIVCNRRTKSSMFSRGYARYVRGGIEVTQAGVDLIDLLPR